MAILFGGGFLIAEEEVAPAATLEIPAIPGVPAMKEPKRTEPNPSQDPGLGLVPGMNTAVPVKAEVLKAEFQLGHTYRFVAKTEFQARTELGTTGNFSMEQQARYDVKVRVDGKPGVVLKGRTERLDLSLQSGTSRLSYESLRPEDQTTPLGRHLRATMNRSIDLTLSESGQIDKKEESGAGKEDGVMPGVPRFGPDDLAQIVASFPQYFSEKRVRPGDEWTRRGQRSVGDLGHFEFEVTYRHAGPVNFEGNSCLAIDYSGHLTGSLRAEAAADSEQRTSSLTDLQSSSLQGRIYFDPLDRMIRFREETVDLWFTWPTTSSEEAMQVPVRETSTIRLLHVIATP